MTPEAQRVAIAEACGWKALPSDDGKTFTGVNPAGETVGWGAQERDFWFPNYLADLNAMHGAEKTLVGDQVWDYQGNICKIVTGALVMATAAQRAEAFLRTIGKWVDNE